MNCVVIWSSALRCCLLWLCIC